MKNVDELAYNWLNDDIKFSCDPEIAFKAGHASRDNEMKEKDERIAELETAAKFWTKEEIETANAKARLLNAEFKQNLDDFDKKFHIRIQYTDKIARLESALNVAVKHLKDATLSVGPMCISPESAFEKWGVNKSNEYREALASIRKIIGESEDGK